MAKANPKAWFSGYTARISYKAVDAWAERMKQHKPYFETWKEAHDFMLDKAKCDLAKAEKALAAAKRHVAKVKTMTAPTSTASDSLEPDPKPIARCTAARDGDCIHKDCPQLRDNEPHATGRHCPLDVDSDDD